MDKGKPELPTVLPGQMDVWDCIAEVEQNATAGSSIPTGGKPKQKGVQLTIREIVRRRLATNEEESHGNPATTAGPATDAG